MRSIINVLAAIFRLAKNTLFHAKNSYLRMRDLDINIYGNSVYLSIPRRNHLGEFLNQDIFKVYSDVNVLDDKPSVTSNDLQIFAIVERTELIYALFISFLRCIRNLLNGSAGRGNPFSYLYKHFYVLSPLIRKVLTIERPMDQEKYSTVVNSGISRIFIKPVSINDPISDNPKKFFIIEGGEIQKRKKKSSNIILCLYVDNLSTYTLKNVILQQNHRFPNIDKICKKGKIIDNSVSASNWTLPAAYSMFRAKPFHQHRIYHPRESVPNDILHTLHGSKNCFDQLQDYGWNTFHVTSNWRASCKQGFSSGFNFSKDLIWQEAPYVSLAAKENIKLGSNNNSFHWISFMDSHHPLVHFVPTPGVQMDLGESCWKSGLNFKQRPNFSRDNSLMSEIYLAQLEMVDREIGNIINFASSIYEANNIDVILLSDHGTSFIKQDKESSYCYREKHSSCLVLPLNRLESKLSSLCQQHIWQHHELLNFILSLATEEQQHLSFLMSEDSPNSFGISQIFYPDAKYEQIFFGNREDIVFVYKSKANIPLNISYRWFTSDRKKELLKSILYDGVWTNPIMNSELSDSQIPVHILDESLNVIKSWAR